MATLPTGPVQTLAPWGGSFGLNWKNVTRWHAEFKAAHAHFPKVPIPVLAGICLVESGGKHYNADGSVLTRAADSYDRVPAIGMMQVKLGYHAWRVPNMDGTTPAGNVMIAAHLMDSGIQKHGTWQKAFVSVYFTGTDYKTGTTQAAYVQTIEGVIQEWKNASPVPVPAPAPSPVPVPVPVPTPEPTPPVDPMRPMPYPAMVDVYVTKPYVGAGFDRVELRRDLIRFFVTHITDGPQNQTIEFFQQFFSTGGARATDALTDLVIGADGRIGILNDWRDPNRGGTRAGWASGPANGLEGPGLAAYRAFPRINVHGLSCEHASKAGQMWTDATIASSIEVRTALAQERKVPWDTYPIDPAFTISIEQAHTFFAAKACPDEPYLNTLEPIILAEVAAKLRAWQTGSDNGDPLPPVEPEPVVTYTDLGLTLDHVSALFGTMQRYNADGSVDDLPFSPDGALSLLWLERCEKERKWPESESIMIFDSAAVPGQELWAQWEGGWVAVLPVGDTKASWVWLDEIERGNP